MKIAFITEYRGMGGGETNLLRICALLSKTHEVGLFCASGKLLETAKTQLNTRFKVFEINPVRNLWRNKWLPVPLFLPRLISEIRKYDIIHSYSPNPLPMLVWSKRPIVWTVHGAWEHPIGIRAWFINLMVEKVFPVSAHIRNIVQIPEKKLELIYLGAVTESNIQQSYIAFDGINLELCCIGSYQHIKGQDVLIDALSLMSTRKPDLNITLWLVGDINSNTTSDHEYKEALLNKIKAITCANIKIMVEGFQGDVDQYIRRSHLVIVPSRYESFSMVTVEALARGKQVVGPDIGGPKEILNTPEIGYLFVPGDPNSLCAKIVEAIASYPHGPITVTTDRASQFTIEKQVTLLANNYAVLLNNSGERN